MPLPDAQACVVSIWNTAVRRSHDVPGWQRFLGLAALVALNLAVCITRLAAQSTFATLTGSVTDSSSAVVPGVNVTATHVGTNARFTGRSNQDGIYSIPNLKEGEYTIRAQAIGFKEIVVDNIHLVAHDIRRLDLQLEVGAGQETIVVTALPGLIETDTPRLSDVLDARTMNTLPVNSRSWMYNMDLSAMSTIPNGSWWPSFAGSRYDQWQLSVNGSSTMDGFGSSAASNITESEAVLEAKLDMVNNNAEFGQPAQVTMVTKSGTNDIHGSAFDYYQSPWFRARDPFALSRATGVVHRPGFAMGGPAVIPWLYNGKNRTFWYVAGEETRGSAATANLNPTVPTQAMRNGDLSSFGAPIRNPFTGQIYSNGIIPPSQINPVSAKILNMFYPLPNYGNTSVFHSQNFRESIRVPFSPTYEPYARLDQKLTGRNYLFASYIANFLVSNRFDGNLPSIGVRYQHRQQKAVNVSDTFTINSSMVNEFRFGFVWNQNPLWGAVNGINLVNGLGLQGLVPDLPNINGIFKITFAGLGMTGLTQPDYHNPNGLNKNLQYLDQFSYFHGRHGIKAGAGITRILYDDESVGSCLFGCATFAATYSAVPGVANRGSAFADFLFGVPTTAGRNFLPLLTTLKRTAYDFFVQDNWKVNSRLTVDLGLRYEYHPLFTAPDGLLAIFDPAVGAIVVGDKGINKVSPLVPAGYAKIVTASSVGLPGNTLLRNNTKDFGPRIGVAYRPWGNNTVFRGGYGIYYNNSPAQPDAASSPFAITEPTYTNTTPAPTLVLPRVFPSTGAGGPSTIDLPTGWNPDVRMPYTQQFSATIEHQHGDFAFRLSYVNTTTRQELYMRDINAPAVSGQPYVSKPRPFPNYPSIYYVDNGAYHSYNGLALEVKRRMARGLHFQSSLTWARDIGNDCGDGCTGPSTIEDPFSLTREKGPAQSTPRLRWVTSAIYELPFGRGRKWLTSASRTVDLMAGGWQISLAGYVYTGQFLTPLWCGNDPTGTAYSEDTAPGFVCIRPDVIGNPNLSHPKVNKWYDVDAFTAPSPGHFGNAGVGTIVGPGTNVWHAGVQKYFTFSENPRAPRLRLEFTATNIFNHQVWANPDMTVNDGASAATIQDVGGNIWGDRAGQRTMRAGVRVEW